MGPGEAEVPSDHPESDQPLRADAQEGSAVARASRGDRPLRLADVTTLRLGGSAIDHVEVRDEQEIVDAVAEADSAAWPVLLVAGGSNLVVSDAGFDGRVILVRGDEELTVHAVDDETDIVVLRAAAGRVWDDVVAESVAMGLAGVECLSGIPGSVGATPVQNVGAYGQEVAQTICSVRVWDRTSRRIEQLTPEQCGFGYRSSILKSQPGRYVVLSVDFGLRRGPASDPVRYTELARALGVDANRQAPLADVREAVLTLRRRKGMVLDASDHDTWSAGSFFTNPILSTQQASTLPPDAPRFPVESPGPGRDVEQRSQATGDGPANARRDEPVSAVKTSAAWLIEQAGFEKGFAVPEAPHVSLSTKHTLALTNRGGATTDELLILARTVRDGVRDAFGVTLQPEPMLVGCSLD